jgi:hypothetical protein
MRTRTSGGPSRAQKILVFNAIKNSERLGNMSDVLYVKNIYWPNKKMAAGDKIYLLYRYVYNIKKNKHGVHLGVYNVFVLAVSKSKKDIILLSKLLPSSTIRHIIIT